MTNKEVDRVIILIKVEANRTRSAMQTVIESLCVLQVFFAETWAKRSYQPTDCFSQPIGTGKIQMVSIKCVQP